MGDNGRGDLRVGGEHLGGLRELVHLTAAVAQARRQREFLHQPGDSGHRPVSVVNSEDCDTPAGRRAVQTGSHRRVGPGRLDDDLVLPSRRPRAEAFTGVTLVRMAGLQIGLQTHRLCRGNGEESDGAAADHQQPLAGCRGHLAQAVPADRERLDKRGVRDRQALGQRHEAFGGDPHPLGEAAVERDSQQSVGCRPAAALGGADAALIARPAMQGRLDAVRLAVDRTGDLMTDGHRQPPRQQREVTAADARRSHLQQRPVTRRLVNVDEGRLTVDRTDSAHRPIVPYRRACPSLACGAVVGVSTTTGISRSVRAGTWRSTDTSSPDVATTRPAPPARPARRASPPSDPAAAQRLPGCRAGSATTSG